MVLVQYWLLSAGQAERQPVFAKWENTSQVLSNLIGLLRACACMFPLIERRWERKMEVWCRCWSDILENRLSVSGTYMYFKYHSTIPAKQSLLLILKHYILAISNCASVKLKQAGLFSCWTNLTAKKTINIVLD